MCFAYFTDNSNNLLAKTVKTQEQNPVLLSVTTRGLLWLWDAQGLHRKLFKTYLGGYLKIT
jgi:hypothetical protein